MPIRLFGGPFGLLKDVSSLIPTAPNGRLGNGRFPLTNYTDRTTISDASKETREAEEAEEAGGLSSLTINRVTQSDHLWYSLFSLSRVLFVFSCPFLLIMAFLVPTPTFYNPLFLIKRGRFAADESSVVGIS